MNITSPRGSVSEIKLSNAQLGSDDIKRPDSSSKTSADRAKGKKGDKKRTKLNLAHKGAAKSLVSQNVPITQGA